MKFQIEIEITSKRERGLTAEEDPADNRNFTLRGNEPGSY